MAVVSNLTWEENLFRIYFATKLHFTVPSYNYLKADGLFKHLSRVKKRPETKLMRFFSQIVDDEPKRFLRLCIANFLYDNPNFIYMETSDAEYNYRQVVSFMQSREYIIKSNLTLLSEKLYNSLSKEQYIKKSFYDDINSGVYRNEFLVYLFQYDPEFLDFDGFFSEEQKLKFKKASTFFPMKDEIKLLFDDVLSNKRNR